MKTTKGDIMKIKEFKLDGNWAEVTWVEESTSISEDGVETTTEKQVHCESYSGHPEHIAMLKDRAKLYDTSLDEYSESIKQLESTYVAPTPEELAEAERVQKLSEAYAYLSTTDYKMTVDYFGSLSKEILDELVLKRAEAREYIRANSGAK